MRLTPTLPQIDPQGLYSTTQAYQLLGMSRSTFWRLSRSGLLKRRLHAIDGKWRYPGKELLRIYNSYVADVPMPRL